MFLDSLRLRLAFMGIGLVALAIFLLAGGHLGPGNRGSIVIEFGADPEHFAGAQVEVDGKVVGVLKPFGSATKMGFAVKKGAHSVRVLRPPYGSRAREISVEPGVPVFLILNYDDAVDVTGRMQPVISFQ